MLRAIAVLLLLLLVGAPVWAVVSQQQQQNRSLQNDGNSIKGYIDAVRQNTDGTYSLVGWACQVSVAASIQVEVYRGGADASQGGVLWKRVQANQASEPGVATACSSSGRKYRFRIPLTDADIATHSGQAIFVQGVRNGNKGLLSNSGKFKFPAAPASTIKGHIDEVSTIANGQVQIRGWACQTGDSRSIAVHVYAGGAAGSPGASLVLHAMANLPSEQAVANVCSVSSLQHRFKIIVPNAAQFANKKVYVHGISTRGTTNLAIGNSGAYKFPSVRPPTPSPPPPPPPPPPDATVSLLSNLGFSNPSRRDLIVPRGTTVTIDTDLDVGLIRVEGKLHCPSSSASYEIKTEGIVVAGNGAELVCGASTNAASQASLSIVLTGNRDARAIYGNQSLGPKAVVVMDGGVARLHGASGREGFTYLRQTAEVGATSIRLLQNVQWKAGDTVVLAPTDFSPHEAEERTIVSVSGNTVRLDRGLTYRHWGATENYNNGKGQSWTLDERAAVFVINRNIRIGSEDDAATRSSRPTGGHFIVQSGGKAFVDNVEFYRMGQAGRAGRYPFHWHRMGNVVGQYIQNSSVHHSFQRCVVIHQSHYAKVISNTCYDHLGHGYFLEDGNEVKNQLIGNLGVLSRKPSTANALLASDIVGNELRFAPTSTFWIAHPDNLVRDNVAAGSEGSGFWMAFVGQTGSGINPAAAPLISNTWIFRNNKAHSCVVGITHDGAPTGALTGNPNNSADRAVANAHYSPSRVPTFSGLVAFKCSGTGIYFRGARAIYTDAILADNARSVFMAYDQEVIDSLVVGKSNNQASNYGGPYYGALVYDGPLWLESVHFSRFSDSDSLAIQKIGAAQLWTNQFRGLTFDRTTRRINSFRGDTGWSDEMCSSVLDVDGSLAGTAGALIVPDHPWNADNRRCSKPTGNDFFTTLVCNYDVTHLWLEGNQVGFTSARLKASNGQRLASIAPTRTYRNKFSMIQGDENEYEVSDLSSRTGARYVMAYFARNVGTSSPLVYWKGFGRCTMLRGGQDIPRRPSLATLRSQNGHGQFVRGLDLVVKLETDANENGKRSDTHRGRGVYVLQC